MIILLIPPKITTKCVTKKIYGLTTKLEANKILSKSNSLLLKKALPTLQTNWSNKTIKEL